MAATVISVEAVTLSGGSATITVPSDCTKVLVQWCYFNASDNQGLASATLNSASPDAISELPTLGGETGTGVIEWNNPATGSRTLSLTFDAATTEGPVIFATYIKGAASTWRDVDHDQGNGTAAVTVTLTTVSGDLVIKHHQRFGAAPSATGGSWTSHQTTTGNGEGARCESIVATGTTQVCDAIDENYGTVSAVAYESSVTVAQDGFAFGTDDNNESTHTLGSGDANHTGPVGVKTLRVQLDTTGDAPSNAYTLRSQKNGSGGYVAVPLTSTSETFPSVAGTAGLTALTSANPGTVAMPSGITAGELLIAVCTGDSSGSMSQSGGSDWTIIAGPANNGTAVCSTLFAKIAAGSDALSVSFEANDFSAVTFRVQDHGVTNVTDDIVPSVAFTSGTSATPDPPSSSGPGGAANYLWIEAFSADDDDTTATYQTSGWTQVGQINSTTGNSTCMTAVASLQSNTATLNPGAMAMNASEEWIAYTFAIPPAVVTNEVYISASANVAAGGEATTARLTAPSGKTTADFATGRRWDDENGSDSIDITDTDYTEVEWILTTQSPATTDDFFDFRVYAGAAALDAYNVTPRWTIGTSGQYFPGLTEETDSAFAVARLKTKAVGLNEETDSVFAVSRLKSRTAGLNEETDSVFAVSRLKTKTVGLNEETDAALPLQTGIEVAVGLAEETDSVLTLTRLKSLSTGLNTETDEALVLTRTKTQAVGLNEEIDSVFAAARTKAKTVGLNAETDEAFVVSTGLSINVGLTDETDSVLTLTRLKSRAVALNEETDATFALSHSKALAVGLNAETDSALALAGSAKSKLLGLATETDAALPIEIPAGPTVQAIRRLRRAVFRGLLKLTGR